MTNPANTLRHHHAVKNESCAGYMTPMRTCTCCKTRRSIGQFPNGATECLQCKRRNG